jgi:hypothetical protein
MSHIVRILAIGIVALTPASLFANPTEVSFSQTAAPIERFDYVEINAAIDTPDVRNPFTDASLTGTFETADGRRHWKVEGFADSADGSLYRIRFMPPLAGAYKYSITYKQGEFQKSTSGGFQTVEAHRLGTLGVDPKYPWHFLWQGTGEHFFFNGTTAFFLMGWKDEHTIDFSIERLHRLKVNRIRVSIAGREATMFGEPVMADLSPKMKPVPKPNAAL